VCVEWGSVGVCQGEVEGYLKPEEDQIRFYPMSVPTRRKVVVLGVQPEVVVDDDVFIV
jgi:CRISPR-associated protein Cas2